MAAYTVDLRPRARRSLRQLDPSARKAIAQVIDGLTADPRPAGVAALTGHRPYLRVRSGDYRVIYSVDDRARVITSRLWATAVRYTGASTCSAVIGLCLRPRSRVHAGFDDQSAARAHVGRVGVVPSPGSGCHRVPPLCGCCLGPVRGRAEYQRREVCADRIRAALVWDRLTRRQRADRPVLAAVR